MFRAATLVASERRQSLLISYPSETTVLTVSPTLVRIRRSWRKYYSLEILKKMVFRNEISSNKSELDFELLKNEINYIQECILANAS